MTALDSAEKERLLFEAQEHVQVSMKQAEELVPLAEKNIAALKEELRHTSDSNTAGVMATLIAIAELTRAGLLNAGDSPYFSRCDVVLSGGECKCLYFGKFLLPELGIYSWTAPAARIRFESPGNYEVLLQNGEKADGELVRNDQYLIAQGKITFMSTETSEMPRTLVHHENFSLQKTDFALTEIVERMEKAQDQVIRAEVRGPLLISGPAGSGKTTLALHRCAYLLQIPEQAKTFQPQDVLVLVQDDSTKSYFDGLLPSLGISHVAIATFASWAKEVLGLGAYESVFRFGNTERERDLLEYGKFCALESFDARALTKKSTFDILGEAYAAYLCESAQAAFARQRKARVLDRFDITILLLQHMHRNDGSLKTEQLVSEKTIAGKSRLRKMQLPRTYALILIDEVQNYLPQHIRILRSCSATETRAITYVGDLAQQTSLFTLKRWEDAGENLLDNRTIVLDKVYRSTRPILEYIRSLGFRVDIPANVREGKVVQKHAVPSGARLLQEVSDIVSKHPEVTTGIIGFSPDALEPFLILKSDKVRVLTVHEAQGVEFDTVIVLGQEVQAYEYLPQAIATEKRKVVRDQLYVALTRAMNELHVFSTNQ